MKAIIILLERVYLEGIKKLILFQLRTSENLY